MPAGWRWWLLGLRLFNATGGAEWHSLLISSYALTADYDQRLKIVCCWNITPSRRITQRAASIKIFSANLLLRLVN